MGRAGPLARSSLALAFVALALVGLTQTHRAALAAEPASTARQVAFRCGELTLADEGGGRQRIHCSIDVIVREGNTLLCCNDLVAKALADGTWREIVCQGDVRLAQADSLLWAERGDWSLPTHTLVLTGQPRLAQNDAALLGERMVLRHDDGVASIVQARGYLPAAAVPTAGPASLPESQRRRAPLPSPRQIVSATQPLPARCPLPPPPPLPPLFAAGPVP